MKIGVPKELYPLEKRVMLLPDAVARLVQRGHNVFVIPPAGKLKKLFQRARIPRSRRTGWPVVVAGSTIIWVASFPVSREFAPRGRSQKTVALEALRA